MDVRPEAVAQMAGSVATRRLTANDVLFAAAMHRALGGPAGVTQRRMERRSNEFIEDCRRRLLDPVLFATVDRQGLAGAALALEGPGRAVLAMIPTSLGSDRERQSTQAALSAVSQECQRRGAVLLQLLAPPEDDAIASVAGAAGFRYLTRLQYLERPADSRTVDRRAPADLCWHPFDRTTAALFERAIEASYAQSTDCPELTGLRPTRDVLAGHRAAGDFDPGLWWAVSRAGRPVGVLLIVRLERQNSLEIAYMGVSLDARGTGVANALMARAAAAVGEQNAYTLTLAADTRNQPALRLYRRWGFQPIGSRDAWIATPADTEGCAPNDASAPHA